MIIGFNFRKITAERHTNQQNGKVNIANNVAIKKVEEAVMPVGTGKQKALRFSYEFNTKYDPNLGAINIEGDVLYLSAPESVDKILKQWKKDKKVAKDILSPVLNTILNRCTIKSLMVSQDLNLPSPMQMPQVTVK